MNEWHAIFHVDNVLISNERKTFDKQSLSKPKAVYKLRLDLWIVCVFVFVRRSSVTRLNGLILIMRLTMLEPMFFLFLLLLLLSLLFELWWGMPMWWTTNGTWLFMSFIWCRDKMIANKQTSQKKASVNYIRIGGRVNKTEQNDEHNTLTHTHTPGKRGLNCQFKSLML